jgi:site-specific DNA recombinase
MALRLIDTTQKTDDKELRVAFYMRVSTAEQELEGYSKEFQQEQLEQHVKRKDYKGWVTKPAWHFYEQASGGDTEGRKELQKLMELVKKGEIDLVLVWKIDRLSRNLSQLLQLFEELDRHGVGFASMKEDLDFTGAIGKLIFQIFGALAEFERENIKMRTQEGKRASALAGNYTGSSVPYGYKGIPNPDGKGKKIEIVPEEAKIVRQIFEWFVQGEKNAEWIAKELNRLGVPKSKGNVRARGTKWYAVTIRTMLAHEAYRGIHVTNRFYLVQKKPRLHAERPKEEWITVRVPSTIDDMLFYMAQEELKKSSLKPKKGGGQETYMLRGKLVEVDTGRGFVGYIATKGTKNYRRKQYVDKDGRKVSSISIAATPLDGFVWGYIEKAINKPEEFLRIHKRRMSGSDEKERLVQDLHLYEDQITENNKKIERVNDHFYDGGIEEGDRQSHLAKYKDQREAAIEGKMKAETEIAQLGQYDAACENLAEFAAKFKQKVTELSYKQKQKLVDMLVERIEISDSDEERRANVLFRFDPKEITASMPEVEPITARNLKNTVRKGVSTVQPKKTGAR